MIVCDILSQVVRFSDVIRFGVTIEMILKFPLFMKIHKILVPLVNSFWVAFSGTCCHFA